MQFDERKTKQNTLSQIDILLVKMLLHTKSKQILQFDEKKLRFYEFLFLTKEGMFVLKLTQPIYSEIVAIAVHITNRNFPL